VRAAGLSNRDGLLLTTWVREGSDPRPDGTPCARAARAGADPVVVTITGVKVRHNGEDSGDGEIRLSAALYDSPNPLHRFVQSESRGERPTSATANGCRPNLPSGEQIAGTSSDDDLEVHYRVSRRTAFPQKPLRCSDDRWRMATR
jgi:hypothetical protein